MKGLAGKKLGMTQIFDDTGRVFPVTLIQILPHLVLSLRTMDKDGYEAVVVANGSIKRKQVNKPVAGQYPEGENPRRNIFEIRDPSQKYVAGESIDLSIFEDVGFVDVKACSKGKGFQGVMKRHGFHGGPRTHGSKFHREKGSTGMAEYPGRVIKGTKMAGRMGNKQVTVQNLRVMKIDVENQVLVVEGAVPGPREGSVLVYTAKKL